MAKAQLKLNEELLKIKDKEMDDLIKSKDELMEDQAKQLKMRDDEIIALNKQIEDLSAKLSSKDMEIDGLQNQTNSDLTKISKLTDDFFTCNGREKCPTGHPNGIFKINKPGMDVFNAFCNSTGWMVVLRRQAPGTEDFNRTWVDYKNGFGDLKGEFFIGLEKLHQLTWNTPHELSFRLGDVIGTTVYAHYDAFQIGSEQVNYVLTSVGKYSGTAGDSFTQHKGMAFTTVDRDNDVAENNYNCANYFGGWWYQKCFWSKLTGKYYKDGISPSNAIGIHWSYFRGYKNSLIFAEMMIKPKSK
ncbi:fibrinogen C domain-containing protein 1-like [Drosophila biarmipes]|uniref:fibrinogen C domain-containing protein 1-like n=1 Tax=Drosophila biarmipes TaxID=125945 RepID=UPI0021CC7C1F|nr:fibrinogen C domain-containing protein 1-like [Drosophila biarmipes]